MLDNLRVLHITRKSSQLSQGTPFIYLQIRNHIKFKPYQACFIDTETQPERLNSLYSSPIEIFGTSFFDKTYFKTFKHVSKQAAGRINAFINSNKIAIVHFHYGSDTTIYFNLIKIIKIPFVVSFYGYDATSFPKWYFGFGKLLLNHIVFRHSSYVLAMSLEMKNELIELGCPKDKVLVHYFGNETDIFRKEDRNYDKSTPVKMLIMASLVDQKGHLFLLKALSRIIHYNYLYKLTIVGEGFLENELKEYVIENKLSENVEFKKNIPYVSPAMVEEYHSADIYLQPSVTTSRNEKEGIPGALVEAMVSGLPVISTYHAGIPSIVKNNETGLLVNEWDIDGLSESIIKLISSTGLRMKLGTAAKEFALRELDSRVKAKELEEIYLQAINQKSN